MPRCKECNNTKSTEEMGDKPGFCQACCDLYRCPICAKTQVPSSNMGNASEGVVCEKCSTKFPVHKGCARKPPSPLLCAHCLTTTITIQPVIPLLSAFFGNNKNPGIEIIGDGKTCSSCGATYEAAKKYCEDHGLSGDSKNAHCVLPQTIIKQTGHIVIDFYNVVCNTNIAKEARKGQHRIALKTKHTISSIPGKLFGAPQEAIDDYLQKLLDDDLDFEICSSDEDEIAKAFWYFTKVTPVYESVSHISKALQIIGQSNLNEFYVGRQCAVCEFIQGDLPLLERFVIAEMLMDAMPNVRKLDQQLTAEVTKLIAQREREEESAFNRFVRKVNESNQSRRPVLLDSDTIDRLRQANRSMLEGVDEYIIRNYKHPDAVHIKLIKNPLIRQWTYMLVGRSFAPEHLDALARVYVGKHLLAAIRSHKHPVEFMMSWLDSDLLPNLHTRIESGYGESLPLEVVRQLWPLFIQYYAVSLLARCREKMTLDEVDRLVKLCQSHLADIMRGDVGKAWMK